MNGKITNYSIETQHDWCLISLVGKLDQAGRIDIFQNSFRIERDLGRLIWAGRRRAFDVELTFEDLSIAIETKVHSDERGRWSESWQTKSIAEQRRNLKGLSFYITYGDSEFYTKPYETGPASPDFHHVTLERMISLVQSSLTAIPQIKESTNSVEWLRLMMIEREKREKAQELLHSFSEFRIRYLKIYEVNDFPRGRVAFSAPDLAFPVFSKLAKHWDESEYVARFGRLSIYPVPRGYSPVVDSILNFWEMWNGEKGPVLARDVVGNERRLYLEINEDFNLNLKLDGEQSALEDEKIETIWKRLQGAKWPQGVNASRRFYRQTTWVLYEIDFGFLANIRCLSKVVSNLGRTLDILSDALNRSCD